jgi:hypothetical protein
MASNYLVQETDGTSKFTLEDSSGAVLLESSTSGGSVTVPGPAPHSTADPLYYYYYDNT